MEDPRSFEQVRETEWCECGYTFFGTMLERLNGLTAHRETRLHKDRMRAIKGIEVDD